MKMADFLPLKIYPLTLRIYLVCCSNIYVDFSASDKKENHTLWPLIRTSHTDCSNEKSQKNKPKFS